MKFKKPIIAATLGLTLLCFGTGASAAEQDTDLVDSDISQNFKEPVNPINTYATPENTSRTETHFPFLQTPYAISKSSSTTIEDYIYAKCRTFNGDGSLIKSTTQDAKKASYVSAKAMNSTYYVGNDYAIGNHTYKLSGYKDVVHETKAYW